ncbi:hypothetical protein [Helicobacter suis]|uniref:hypothetical protein n=1 Tax=Helicobacter suis TaxID=104628 RepID=UPI001F083AD3|nr:hypothetical protein [Helicobacter suis]
MSSLFKIAGEDITLLCHISSIGKSIGGFLLEGLLLALLLGGCSSRTVIAAKFDCNVKYLVQFNSSDFNVGGLVSAEMPYNPKNPNMTELLLDKAIAACNCDTLLLPRYEIIHPGGYGITLIKVTGRAATFRAR